MIKAVLKKLAPVLVGVLISFSFVPMVAQAQTVDDVCSGVAIVSGGTGCGGAAAQGRVEGLIRDIIQILSIVVGVVAVIMIMIGGFRYITSGGDSSSVSGAKNTILYALVGLVIAAFAQIIVRFVLGRVQ